MNQYYDRWHLCNNLLFQNLNICIFKDKSCIFNDLKNFRINYKLKNKLTL